MIVFSTIASGDEKAEQLIAKWAVPEDRTQANTRHSETRKHEFLLARAALRALLHHVSGSDNWMIRPDPRGKPYALTPTGETGPHISLSHTKGLVACAVSQDGAIGIDVEYWRKRDFTALAEYAFTDDEHKEVLHEGMPAFYRIWTIKEAQAKAMGEGIFSMMRKYDGTEDAMHFYYISPQSNYSLAIAFFSETTLSENIRCILHDRV